MPSKMTYEIAVFLKTQKNAQEFFVVAPHNDVAQSDPDGARNWRFFETNDDANRYIERMESKSEFSVDLCVYGPIAVFFRAGEVAAPATT